MRSFAYHRPAALSEAIELVSGAADGQSVRPLAGGTDLLTLMKGEIVAPVQLIDIKRLPELSREIVVTDDGLTLGALTSLSAIENHLEIRERYRPLAEAVAIAATPQLRNMATIAGNLLQRPRCWYFRNHDIPCWLKGGSDCPAREGENQLHALFGGDASPCVATHPSDPASALLLLDATINVRGAGGERAISARDFFALPSDERRTETTLTPDELIVSITVPRPDAGTRGTYLKAMDRKVWDFAVVAVAATARVVDGSIQGARLVLSGVAPIPWAVDDAAAALIGQVPSDELFAQVAEQALAGANPLAKNGYKVPLAKALIRRALTQITSPEQVS